MNEDTKRKFNERLTEAQFRRRQIFCLGFVIALVVLTFYGWLLE